MRRTILGVCLAVTAVACGARGRGAANVDSPAPAPKGAAARQAAPLLERAKEEVKFSAGANYFHTTVNYRGGPNESWVLVRRAQIPPDLETKPGNHDDDPDVKAPVPAAPGVAAIEPQVPDFCPATFTPPYAVHFATARGMSTRSFAELPETIDFTGEGDASAFRVLWRLQSVAFAACDRLRYAPRQRRVANWLQQWTNATRMPLAETKVLLSELAAMPESPIACGKDPQLEYVLCGDLHEALPNRGVNVRGVDAPVASLADLDARERAGRLFDADRLVFALQHASGGQHEVLAAAEARRIDWGTAERQLRDAAGPIQRFLMLRTFGKAKQRVTQLVERVPAGKLEVAEMVHRDWEKMREANKEVVDRALDALEHPDVSQVAALRADFAAIVRKKAPTSLKEALGVVRNPMTNLVARALAASDRAAGRVRTAEVLERALGNEPRFRGPRELYANQRGGSPSNPTPRGTGTIDKLSVTDAGVRVQWVPRTWTEDVERCVETNRVDRIDSSGRIVYREICTKVGVEQKKETYEPSLFPKELTPLLKAGQVPYFAEEQSGPAFVALLYPDAASAEAGVNLLVYLGVPLK